MKKILIILFLLPIALLAQKRETVISVADSTTAIGIGVPSGSIIWDKDNNRAWKTEQAAAATDALEDLTKQPFALDFNGDRTVKRAGLPNVNAGGDDLFTWIENYFFPFLPATISMNGSVLYEIGTDNTVGISGSTTSNDETIFSGGVVDRITPAPQTTVYSFGANLSYSTSVNFYPKQSDAASLSATYRAFQDVDNNGSPTTIQSNIKSLSSVYTFLYGTSASDLTGGGTLPYTTLTKLVQAKSDKSVTLTGSNVFVYFCYPSSYGDLTSILDQNGFEVLTAFTKTTVSVSSSGLDEDYSESYNIYKLNNLTSPAAWVWQFKF